MGKLTPTGIGAQKNVLKIDQELFQKFKRLRSSHIDENGHEIPNPVPAAVHITRRPISLQEQIKRLVKTELSSQAVHQGHESWEEANDFDIEDEGDPLSQYVVHDMIPEEPIETPPPAPADPGPGPGNQPSEAETETE